MKQLLVLFTNGFPYLNTEPFLQEEYPLYVKYFDHVLIVSSCHEKTQPILPIDHNRTDLICDNTVSGQLSAILSTLPFVLTDRMFYREIFLVFKQGITFSKLRKLLALSFCANHQALSVRRWLKAHSEYTVSAFYGYWMQVPAYAAIRAKQLLRVNCRTIARAHGYDLYPDRQVDGYLPFHRQLFEQIDSVATVSDHGKNYLEAAYGTFTPVYVHRLGVYLPHVSNPEESRTPLRIISCSRVVTVKRLNRIIDILKALDIDVHWTHFGDGEGLSALKDYAKKVLPANIRYTFAGFLSKEKIFDIYAHQPFHAFLNVSDSEGIPVAMMEAMGYGIPAIGPAIGGIPELIRHETNGYLILNPADHTEYAHALLKLSTLPDDAYHSLRQAARSSV